MLLSNSIIRIDQSALGVPNLSFLSCFSEQEIVIGFEVRELVKYSKEKRQNTKKINFAFLLHTCFL